MTVVCLVLAFLCELVASLTGFGWLVHADHPAGWLALGLVFLVASMLVGALPAIPTRRD